jgi:hypothetical protein
MPAETIHACQCGPCGRGEAHPERERHYQTNLFLSRLDEDQRRWYLALESQRMGWGADRLLMEISGVDEKTIRRGREELAASLVNRPADRVRQPGAGRPPVEKKTGLANFAGVRARFLREGRGSGCSEVPTHGAHTCTAHTQLVAIASRV